MYFLCVILFCYVIVTTNPAEINSRSVNVNLETVLQFDPKDDSGDGKIIDNIQHFLGNVKSAIDKKPTRRSQVKPEATIKFTEFVKNAINILKTYNDDDLEDAVNVIDDEIRKYHYKGCKFHELVQNGDLRRYVAGKLSAVQNQDAEDIKRSLNKVLTTLDNSNMDDNLAGLLDYIDSLYRHNDVGKMRSFLNNIETYGVKSKRANLDLLRIVRNGVRGLIFDHYSKLNPNARKELRIRIESFWNRNVDGSTTTTTNKKFDFVNSFNFLKDFTFEFVTPESFTTKTTEYTTPRKQKVSMDDAKREKKNQSPEVMSNNSDNDESKEKSFEQPKKKRDKHKKNKEHKRNREHKKNKKSHDKSDDESVASERKHKSNKHKSTHVFRQHNVTEDDSLVAPQRKHKSNEHVFKQNYVSPVNVFDYKAVINVRGQTDTSDTREVWKPNESYSFEESESKPILRTDDYRKRFTLESEEGLSIEFKPSPTAYTESTTKTDEFLIRRLNNLEKAVEIVKSKINDDKEEINVTPSTSNDNRTLLVQVKEPAKLNRSLNNDNKIHNRRRTPVALAFVQNNELPSHASSILATSKEQEDNKTMPTWKQLEIFSALYLEPDELATAKTPSAQPIEENSATPEGTDTHIDDKTTNNPINIEQSDKNMYQRNNGQQIQGELFSNKINNTDKFIEKQNITKNIFDNLKITINKTHLLNKNNVEAFRAEKRENILKKQEGNRYPTSSLDSLNRLNPSLEKIKDSSIDNTIYESDTNTTFNDSGEKSSKMRYIRAKLQDDMKWFAAKQGKPKNNNANLNILKEFSLNTTINKYDADREFNDNTASNLQMTKLRTKLQRDMEWFATSKFKKIKNENRNINVHRNTNLI